MPFNLHVPRARVYREARALPSLADEWPCLELAMRLLLLQQWTVLQLLPSLLQVPAVGASLEAYTGAEPTDAVSSRFSVLLQEMSGSAPHPVVKP